MTNKWSDPRVCSVIKAYLTSKLFNKEGLTYNQIAEELSKIFPEYDFTGESVRHFWRDNKETIKPLPSFDGRVNIENIKEIKTWNFKEEKIEVVCVADTHGLDQHAHYNIFRDKIDYIQDKDNAYILLVGDLINFATKNSVSSPYTSRDPRKEIKIISTELLRVKNKILGAVGGNHDKDRGLRSDGLDPMDEIMAIIGLSDLYYFNIGVLNLKLSNVNYYTVFAHGTGRGISRKKPSQLNSLEYLHHIYPSADLYITGHTHLPGLYLTSIRDIDRIETKIRSIDQYCISIGSCMGYEDSYAEAKLLEPQPIKLAHIFLHDHLDNHGGKIVDVRFRN